MFSFISIEFSILFTAFFCVYWLFSHHPRIQNLLLLIGSYSIIYLMAGWFALTTLLIFTILIYFISLGIEKNKHAKHWLISGILLTLINLAFWKYFDFFRTQISTNTDSSSWLASIILPLGISYYSFQSVSYLVELYRHPLSSPSSPPRLGLANLSLHLAFFTTITAGPIARSHHSRYLTDIYGQQTGMAEQIRPENTRKILAPVLALLLILIALIKNWWLSGWIGEKWVDPVFMNPTQYHSMEILAAIYGYTVQLFLDFSGYSDLMVALGLLLGFRLPINFRAPLLAHNIREFWKRWHISLSTWIQDYIYIPLGGNRKGFTRTQSNLLIAMVLSGLWHGSEWHFLIWGLLHGIGMICLNIGDAIVQFFRHCNEHEARNSLQKTGWLGKTLAIIFTINFVCFCFVFFRAPTIQDAFTLFSALGHNTVNIPLSSNPFAFLLFLIIIWLLYPFLNKVMAGLYHRAENLPRYHLIVPLLMILILILICAPSGIPGFIYAKF